MMLPKYQELRMADRNTLCSQNTSNSERQTEIPCNLMFQKYNKFRMADRDTLCSLKYQDLSTNQLRLADKIPTDVLWIG